MENNAQPQQVQPQADASVSPTQVGEIPMPATPPPPQSVAQPEEDHRTILERITGIFNRGKKDKVQEPVVESTSPSVTPPQQ